MLQFKNVLCPIDFSETSARALTYATALARWYDAHLEVLHVVPAFEHDGPPTDFDTAGGAWPSREQLIIEVQGAIAAAGASGLNHERWRKRDAHTRSFRVAHAYCRLTCLSWERTGGAASIACFSGR